MGQRVYLTQAPRLNLDVSAAKEWGELVPLLPAGRLVADRPDVIAELELGLADFNPEKDLLVPLGDPIVILLVGAILRARGVRSFPTLRWDHMTKTYSLLTVTIT